MNNDIEDCKPQYGVACRLNTYIILSLAFLFGSEIHKRPLNEQRNDFFWYASIKYKLIGSKGDSVSVRRHRQRRDKERRAHPFPCQRHH